MTILIGNRGQEIADTNYWDSDLARRGFFFLSWNAGAARLLIPDAQLSALPEMRTGQYCDITRNKTGGYELLFEDHSDFPYVIALSAQQTDRAIPDCGEGFPLFAISRTGVEAQWPATLQVIP